MNEEYLHYIVHRGREYRYDPDYDCFYPVERYRSLSTWDKWSPAIVILVLTVIAVYVEFLR